jgi:hypothetical protein
MTNRVRITAGRIKVSRPGVDVDAATAGQLVFDTGSYVGARYLKEYISGFFAVGPVLFQSNWSEQRDNQVNFGAELVNYAVGGVSFGKTFSAPPKHFMCVVHSNLRDPLDNSYGSVPPQTFTDGYGDAVTGDPNTYMVFSRTTTTGLAFCIRKKWGTTQLIQTVPIIGFAYVVYDQ